MQATSIDETKHYLGKVCKHGHEWNGTGRGLRRRSKRDCVECKWLGDRTRAERGSARRNTYLLRTYGLTNDQYEMLLASQGGVCAICEEPPDTDRALSVDHCHRGGHVRGILCDRCNHAIGLMRDDPRIANKAVEYLLKF